MPKPTFADRLLCRRATLAEWQRAVTTATRTNTTHVESGVFTDHYRGDVLVAYRVDMPYHAPQTYVREQ